MSRIKAIIATVLLSIFATVASADVIYLGAGGAKTGNPEISDAMPFSLGYISHAAENTILGFDIAQEGTMLDSTWGQNSVVSSALSVNLIYGYKISDNGTSRLDIGGLLGIRQTFSDCPDSYIGYQCYADTAPQTDFTVNYGVVMTYSHNKIMLGLRATGESVQALIGTRF